MSKSSLKALLAASVAASALLAMPTVSQAQVAEQLVQELRTMDAKQREAFQLAMRNAIQSPERGKEEVTLEVNGQVDRLVFYANDGDSDGFLSADNGNSTTRFRLLGKARINEDVSAGTVWETEFDSENSNDGTVNLQSKSPTAGTSTLDERKLELYFDSKTLGRLWLGQGDTASNGTAESDLTGTEVVDLTANTFLIGGGVQFQDSGVVSATSVGDAFNSFDGPFSRNDRIRYDTPSLGGLLKLSADWVNGDGYSFGAFADTKIGGNAIRARAGYTRGMIGGGFDNSAAGSLSFATAFGLTGAISGGWQDNEPAGRDDEWGAYGKLGWLFRGNPLGDTAAAVSYHYVENDQQDNDEATAYSLIFVQNVDAIAGEIYAKGSLFSLDRTGANYDDIYVVSAGSRIKF